jgi:putative PIN family toxin of toxin-antitoxin system
VVSPKLLEELSRVLAYPKIAKRIDSENAGALLRLLEDEAQVSRDPEQPSSIEIADPDDAYLLALAAATGAALVSGDRHLTVLGDRFPVFAPADFLAHLGGD